MSIERICWNCSAEYDARIGLCPACAIQFEARAAKRPYSTWRVTGYYSFEMFGEAFAATRNNHWLGKPWRVTHVATGAAIPGADSEKAADAVKRAKAALKKVGATKFRAIVAKTNKRISAAAKERGE